MKPLRPIRRPADRMCPTTAKGSDDSGFTLVELTVAAGVILTALVLMGSVLTSGLASTAVSRERQTANGLANKALETVRALPFAALRSGLRTSDLAADPAVTTSGCNDGAYCFNGERIVAGNNPPVDPLVPHIKTVTTGDNLSKAFDVATYVTYYQNNLTANAYRVTSRVTWSSAVRARSAQKVEAQTIMFPSGCLSLPDHPYSGPCQSSFTASAAADPASISAQGRVGGVDVSNAVLYGAASTSDATIEQTARVDGITQGSGATVQAAGGAEQSIGRQLIASQADNDPEATKSIYETKSMPPQAGGSAALTSTTGGLAAQVGGGDSGNTTSTTSASTSAARLCPNLASVTNENDTLPCGGSSATTGTSARLNAHLNVALLNVAAFPIAVIGSQVSPNTAITDRSSSTGIDTARATISRSALNLAAGGLPDVLKPVGFTDAFVRVTGYADSASAQSGVGSTAPTAATTGGTLSFYTGALLNPYTTVNLSSVTSSTTIPTLSVYVALLDTRVTMSATVTPESKPSTSSCAGSCTRTSASQKVVPMKITLRTTIVASGITALDLTTVLDPGTINAKASYVAAPTA